MRKIVLCGLPWMAACLHIESRTLAIDTALSSAPGGPQVVEHSMTYTVEPDVHDGSLALTILQTESCEEIANVTAHRVTRTERHIESAATTGIWVVGTLFTLVGVPSYFGAEGIATSQTQQGMPTTPGDVRTGAIVAIAVGGLTLLTGVGNYLRAIDTERDDGTVQLRNVVATHPCNEGPTSATRVTLKFGGAAVRSAAETDRAGRVEIALTDVTLAAFPRNGGEFSVEVGGRAVSFKLADNEVAELRRALVANPDARLAKDLGAACSVLFDRIDAALSRAASRATIAQAGGEVHRAEVDCATPDQRVRAQALFALMAALERAIEEAEQRAAHEQRKTGALVRWACQKDHIRALGFLSCAAPAAVRACRAVGEKGIPAGVALLLQELAVPPTLASAISKKVMGGKAKQIGARLEVMCRRWTDERLPEPEDPDPLGCIVDMLSESVSEAWSLQACNSVASP